MTHTDTQNPSRWRTARWLALTVLLALGAGEIAVRAIHPTPRVQVIAASDRVSMWVEDGVPLWEGLGTAARQNVECHGDSDAQEILVVGSSIFFGTRLDNDAVFSQLLHSRLHREHPGANACVVNVAQPGFALRGKIAMARRHIARRKPKLVLFELWYNDVSQYVHVEDRAYNTTSLRVDESGNPNLFGLPVGLNRWMLLHSRLYEYATLTLGVRGRTAAGFTWEWMAFVNEQVPELVTLSKETGVPFLFLFSPRLKRPLAETARELPIEYRVFKKHFDAAGIRSIDLAEAMSHYAVEDIALDECCHFNPQGHEVLADLFYPHLLRALGIESPPPDPPATPGQP